MPLSDIKVLLLNVNRTGWHSGNMIYDMEAVKRACDTKMYGPGWPGYRHTNLKRIISQLYGNGKPDVIYSYFTPNETVRNVYMTHYKLSPDLRKFPTGFQDVKGIRKIFALSDFWARKPRQYSRDLYDSSFEYCFCCFAPPYSDPNQFYQFFSDKVRQQIKFVGYPRCVDKECFKNYGEKKQFDVITVGAMHGFYPWRTHMHHHLRAHASSLGIKYHNYPHCGVDFTHSNFVRENYAKAINGSKMLASCGGIYHLAMNKIFESMGCETAYVGEKPWGAAELHLKDGHNFIAVDPGNFAEKIKHYLDRPAELEQIVRNAKKTFNEHHHIDARAAYFVKLLEKVL